MASLRDLPHHPPVEWVGFHGPYLYTSVQMTEFGRQSWNAAIELAAKSIDDSEDIARVKELYLHACSTASSSAE